MPKLVVIYNADRTNVEAVLNTRPAYRLAPIGLQLTLVQQPNKQPEALLRWFNPGTNYGHYFIYSDQTQKRFSEQNTLTMTVDPARIAANRFGE